MRVCGCVSGASVWVCEWWLCEWWLCEWCVCMIGVCVCVSVCEWCVCMIGVCGCVSGVRVHGVVCVSGVCFVFEWCV